MYNDVTDTFKANLHVTIDAEFLRKIKAYRLAWTQKSDMYMEFLGSNLTGVYPIRFSVRDEEYLFVDILNVNLEQLTFDLHNKTKGVDKNKKTASNVFFLTLVYLMHLTYKSKLPNKDKNDLLKELYYIFAYRYTSLLTYVFFSYSVEPEIATAAYEKLSKKYLIKKLNNWNEVFEYRSLDVSPPNGLHMQRIINLNSEGAARVIVDLVGRMKEMFKNIFRVTDKVAKDKEQIRMNSKVQTDDDGEKIKDLVNSPQKYSIYIKNIINSKNDFINPDYMYIVLSVFKNITPTDLENLLSYISENNFKDRDYVIDAIIQTSIVYLNGKGIVNNYTNHVSEIITFMKFYYGGSSVKDPDVLKTKKILTNVFKKTSTKITNWVISGTVIAAMVYILIRTLIRDK